MIRVEDLDKRICDMEDCENEQTYREFIRESEEEFGIEHANLDFMEDFELDDYFDFLDELWNK